MANDRLELIWGVAFGAGALAQLLARWSGLPSVVLLLALGLLVGQGGLGWVDPQALGHGLEPLVGLLVSMVLFDGGLGLQLSGPSSLRTLTTLRLVWARWPLGLLGGGGGGPWAGGPQLAVGLGVRGDRLGDRAHGGDVAGAADPARCRSGRGAGG